MSNKPVYDSSEVSSRIESEAWQAHALRKAVEYDAYGSKTVFRVRVLTRPNNISKEDFEAVYGSSVAVVGTGNSYTRYMFKGRIETEEGFRSPHMTLPDPCNITDADDPECAARIISWHTTFMSGDNVTGPRPEVGDIVKVTLSPGDIGKYNLQYAIFDRVENQAANPSAATATAECALKLTQLFAGTIGKAMSLGTATANATQAAAGIAVAATSFSPRTGTYLPTNTPITNGSLAGQGLIRTATKGSPNARPRLLKDVVGDYDRLAAAFNAKFGPSKQLGGWGDRTFARQLEFNPDGKTRGAAIPGTSKHGWGIAVDLHYWIGNTRHKIPFGSAEFAWLSENARSYGWYHPAWAQQNGSLPEPWHWESTKDTQLIRVDPK